MKKLLLCVLVVLYPVMAFAAQEPLVIQEQGSFLAGGSTLTDKGEFVFSDSLRRQCLRLVSGSCERKEAPAGVPSRGRTVKTYLGDHARRTRRFYLPRIFFCGEVLLRTSSTSPEEEKQASRWLPATR